MFYSDGSDENGSFFLILARIGDHPQVLQRNAQIVHVQARPRRSYHDFFDTIILDELAHARFGHFSAALVDEQSNRRFRARIRIKKYKNININKFSSAESE